MGDYTRHPVLVGSRETAIGLKLWPPASLAPDCGPVSLPPPTYVLYYSPVEAELGEDAGETCGEDAKKCWVKVGVCVCVCFYFLFFVCDFISFSLYIYIYLFSLSIIML